jgi:Zn-dependent protease
MNWSSTLFSIRGIAVKVHVTFALIVVLGALRWSDHGLKGVALGVAFTLALFTCVLLHELGHSFAARAFGLRVREIVLLPIGGVASLVGKPRSPKHEIAIALAGPAVNLVIAAMLGVAMAAFGLWPRSLEPGLLLAPSLPTFLLLLVSGNVSLAVFNLLPFFPLDGGRVLRAGLALRWGETRATLWAARLGQVAGVGLAGYALFSGHVFLALIAGLIFLAASRERAEAQFARPLSALRAADVAEVPALELDASYRVSQVLPLLLRSQQSAFPLIADAEVLGIVLRDELIAAGGDPRARLMSIRTLVRRAPRIDAELSVEQALELLQASGQPVGVVVNREQPLGLLAASQVYAKLAQAPELDWGAANSDSSSLGLRRSAA